MVDKFWYKVARLIVKSGVFPFPVSDALIELLQELITEEQAKFLIQSFKKPSLTLEQIKENSHMDESSILETLDVLMYNGIIIGTKSKSSGVNVYRLMGPFPGIFEYTNLRGETDEKHVKLAKMFQKLFSERRGMNEENYETMINTFKNFPPTDRTLPVEKEVEVGTETVMPFEELKKYVEEYDDIAVAHCYCRHHQDLVDNPCKLGASKKNCFLFDKSAVFAIEKNFGDRVSKEEAMKIFRKAEDQGLVHKVFHVHSDVNRGIEAVCNCCKCCCGIIGMYRRGIMPLHTVSSYLAEVNKESCIGCGTCVEMCPMETIELDDTIAVVSEEKCIGCGVCAHHCPEDAIHLRRTGPRDVFIPPERVATS
ncbi:MAG: indolepyruvate ferredoxin oxidoreductase subunit alpha [Promethearchaeota archaeon]|jgi:NAD-dependent dihydropyrimidine dehydrogenase PreA subunit